jgi:mRNA interferase RelE/StbE
MSKKRRSGSQHAPPDRLHGDTQYSVILVRSARKELLDLPDELFNTVSEHLKLLSQNPRPFGSEKLTARTEYKFRAGDIRIIYEINDTDHTVQC